MDLFFLRESVFESYSAQHLLPVILVSVFGLWLILFARGKDTARQYRILFYLSLIPCIGTLLKYPFIFANGSFDLKEDLPLHLCRFIAVLAPLVALWKNRFWMGVFYFWILVGTLQANITPDVEFGFPHWSYFAYWMMHTVLVIVAFYYIFVLKIKIGWRDLGHAFIMMNVFILATLAINFMLDSNYMYTMAKPPVRTMLDLLGPWPVYLVSGQLLVLVLFALVLLPLKIRDLIA